MFSQNHLTQEQTRDGLFGLNITDLTALATTLGIIIPSDAIEVSGTRNRKISDSKEKVIYLIWENIAKEL